MGPTRAREQKLFQEDVQALLREKDDRIVILETRLEAYSARASTAHTRLMKTIDVLDALRSQHALEISTEEQAKMKLIHEVDRWRTAARDLEVEKDELKDVVEDLIEKVQASNEWNSWPCSRMRISKHADNLNVEFPEQVAIGALDGRRTEDDCQNDLLAYATSIIARLRTELEFERQSHRRTVEEANMRIEELEAKVAVREAELENYITPLGDHENQPGGSHDKSTRAPEKRTLDKRVAEPKPLSDDECLRFLESNNARNRSLELEICHIAKRLEQARMAALSSSGSQKELQPPTPRNGHKSMPTRSPRTRSASVDSNVLSRLPDTGNITPAPAPTSMMLSITQLDNQICTMTAQMDALVSERTTLIEAAAKQRRVTEGINIDTFQDVLRVEGECVRLQAEVDDLREQLQHAHTSARDKEVALLQEIAQLRASSLCSPSLRPTHELHHPFSPQLLEENIASAEGMELASPLIPTAIPNSFPASPRSDLPVGEDLLPPLFCPEHMPSPAHDAPLTLTYTTLQSPDTQEIERVQAALDVAQTDLEQKEETLSQLRAEMERLRLELETREEDGSERV